MTLRFGGADLHCSCIALSYNVLKCWRHSYDDARRTASSAKSWQEMWPPDLHGRSLAMVCFFTEVTPEILLAADLLMNVTLTLCKPTDELFFISHGGYVHGTQVRLQLFTVTEKPCDSDTLALTHKTHPTTHMLTPTHASDAIAGMTSVSCCCITGIWLIDFWTPETQRIAVTLNHPQNQPPPQIQIFL